MQYKNVCLESFGYTLPEEVVSTAEIERRLSPLYRRLRLPEGRLELMSGIRERRFFPPGTPPSEISVQSAEKAIAAADIDRGKIGALIHGSVCRDYLEPATATGVHHQLGLARQCLAYDVSNACLGLLNGALQIANMIELGQIQAGLVVGAEDGRNLVEHTIATLNNDHSITRKQVKLAVASLTIGSASGAMLLTHRDISRTGNRLVAASATACTDHHSLCRGDVDHAHGAAPLMQTDSEKLMLEGVAAGVHTYKSFLEQTNWSPDEMHKTFCHQVGQAHRKLMLESLDLDPSRDFATVSYLGNTGSAALPTTMAIGLEQGFVEPGENIGMLGIGSGINCLMLGVHWQKTLVCSQLQGARPQSIAAGAT